VLRGRLGHTERAEPLAASRIVTTDLARTVAALGDGHP
jgi:hypothetical protein